MGNDEENNQMDPAVADYIKQKFLSGVPSSTADANPVTPVDTSTPEGEAAYADQQGTDAGDTGSGDTSAAKATDSAPAATYDAAGYQKLASDSKADLAAARERAANSNTIANIGQSLATMFKGSHQLDPSVYNNLRAGNNQALAQATQDRQELLKNYLMGNTLTRQATADQRAAQQFDWAKQNQDFTNTQHTRQLAQQQDFDNPNSEASQALRGMIGKIAPEIAKDPNFPNASYTQLSQVYPHLISAYEAAQGRIESAKMRGAIDADRRQRQGELDQERRDKEARAELTGAQNKLNGETKDMYKSAAAADDLDAKIDEARVNPAQNSMLPVAIARAAIQGGRINQQEIAKAGGSQAILDKAAQVAKNLAEGTLTDDNAKWMKSMASLAKKGAMTQIQDAEERHVGQYMQAHPDMDFEDAYSDLTGGKTYNRQVTKTDPDGTVHTATVKNLKELQEARSKGFK